MYIFVDRNRFIYSRDIQFNITAFVQQKIINKKYIPINIPLAVFRTGKNTPTRRAAVREAGACRHQGGQLRSP